MAQKFRKKPIVVEAMRYLSSTTIQDLAEFGFGMDTLRYADGAIFIRTLEGEMRADQGDWLIKGIKGEFYPCKPDIFWATYERLDPYEVYAPGAQR